MAGPIDIILNGEQKSLDSEITAAALLQQMTLSRQRIAVEINGEIVPRSQFAEHRIAHGDRIEIIHAVGGG